MGVLNKDEIVRQLVRGELIKHARRNTDGHFAVEGASYDLMAGKVVWKDPETKKLRMFKFDEKGAWDAQNTVTLQSGQMCFVITHEEILMPTYLCGTVLSRNSLAKQGILALNAGHVDPGYEGPIIIRLISLRAQPWTLRLGTPIFTIVFQTLDHETGDKLEAHPKLSAEAALAMVERMADDALGNALFDMYDQGLQRNLFKHYAGVLSELRETIAKDFVKKDEFGSALWHWTKSNIVSILAFIGIVMTIIVRWRSMMEWLKK